jgi:hypothetical protein
VKIVEAKPVYPALGRQSRVEGTVLIDASIDEQGKSHRPASRDRCRCSIRRR